MGRDPRNPGGVFPQLLEDGEDESSGRLGSGISCCFPCFGEKKLPGSWDPPAGYLSSWAEIERRETNQARQPVSESVHSSDGEGCPADQLCLQPFRPGPLEGCHSTVLVTKTQAQRLRVGGCPPFIPVKRSVQNGTSQANHRKKRNPDSHSGNRRHFTEPRDGQTPTLAF